MKAATLSPTPGQFTIDLSVGPCVFLNAKADRGKGCGEGVGIAILPPFFVVSRFRGTTNLYIRLRQKESKGISQAMPKLHITDQHSREIF